MERRDEAAGVECEVAHETWEGALVLWSLYDGGARKGRHRVTMHAPGGCISSSRRAPFVGQCVSQTWSAPGAVAQQRRRAVRGAKTYKNTKVKYTALLRSSRHRLGATPLLQSHPRTSQSPRGHRRKQTISPRGAIGGGSRHTRSSGPPPPAPSSPPSPTRPATPATITTARGPQLTASCASPSTACTCKAAARGG